MNCLLLVLLVVVLGLAGFFEDENENEEEDEPASGCRLAPMGACPLLDGLHFRLPNLRPGCFTGAMKAAENSSEDAARAFKFTTTHWSVVLTAQGDTPASATALEQLCRTYWYPLYAHVRHQGYSPEDAQDLTQSFFLHLLLRKPFAGVHPDKGRFRSFLLAALTHFLADQRDHDLAQKRGGGRTMVSLDVDGAEARYCQELVDAQDPAKLFERRWALTLLEQVLLRLEQDYTQTGRAAVFQHLKPFLVEGSRAKSHAAVAAEAGLSEEAVKKGVQRLRWRYGRLFREEIAHTVADPAEVEQELCYLRQVMAQ